MTREEKINNKKLRSLRRKMKRINKDREFSRIAFIHDKDSISWGRNKSKGRVFICDMRYRGCEERGYCNGDC